MSEIKIRHVTLDIGVNQVSLPIGSRIIDVYYANLGPGWIMLIYEFCEVEKKKNLRNFYVKEIGSTKNEEVNRPNGKYIGKAVYAGMGRVYLIFEEK